MKRNGPLAGSGPRSERELRVAGSTLIVDLTLRPTEGRDSMKLGHSPALAPAADGQPDPQPIAAAKTALCAGVVRALGLEPALVHFSTERASSIVFGTRSISGIPGLSFRGMPALILRGPRRHPQLLARPTRAPVSESARPTGYILDGLFLLLSNIEPRLTKRKCVVRAPAIFFRLNLVRRSQRRQQRYYRYTARVWDFHAAM